VVVYDRLGERTGSWFLDCIISCIGGGDLTDREDSKM
jgi:hypothetical protein